MEQWKKWNEIFRKNHKLKLFATKKFWFQFKCRKWIDPLHRMRTWTLTDRCWSMMVMMMIIKSHTHNGQRTTNKTHLYDSITMPLSSFFFFRSQKYLETKIKNSNNGTIYNNEKWSHRHTTSPWSKINNNSFVETGLDKIEKKTAAQQAKKKYGNLKPNCPNVSR